MPRRDKVEQAGDSFVEIFGANSAAAFELVNLASATPIVDGMNDPALVDIDDTIKEVHPHKQQGAGFGYSGIRGLNALLAIISTGLAAPIIVACPRSTSAARRGSIAMPGAGGPH